MHPFPNQSELQFLVGQQIEQICLGLWQIQFNFDSGRIIAEFDVEHVDESGSLRRHNTDEDRLKPIVLHHLLGKRVEKVAAEDFCLTLTFEGLASLRFRSEIGPYECGQIYDVVGNKIVF